jgi:hypothetical protein
VDTEPYGGWTKILAILCMRARTFKNGSLMIFFSSQFECSAGFLHIFARILVHPQKHNPRWRTGQYIASSRNHGQIFLASRRCSGFVRCFARLLRHGNVLQDRSSTISGGSVYISYRGFVPVLHTVTLRPKKNTASWRNLNVGVNCGSSNFSLHSRHCR